MPSVADVLKWRDKWTKTPTTIRNGLITEAINWLESVARPKCKPEELSMLINLENELQQKLNEIRIPDQWFVTFSQTYGQQSYFHALVTKCM